MPKVTIVIIKMGIVVIAAMVALKLVVSAERKSPKPPPNQDLRRPHTQRALASRTTTQITRQLNRKFHMKWRNFLHYLIALTLLKTKIVLALLEVLMRIMASLVSPIDPPLMKIAP